MRNRILFAASALVAIAAASSAFATADNASIQANVGTIQAGTSLSSHLTVGASLKVSTDAVGNNLTVISNTPSQPVAQPASRKNDGDVRNASLQVNALTTQTAVTGIDTVVVGGDLNISTQAVGNNADIETTANFDPGFHQALTGGALLQGLVGQNDGSTGIQVNALTAQTAATAVNGAVVFGKTDSNTLAVGDSLSVTAAQNGTFAALQANVGTLQLAGTSVSNSAFVGNSTFATSAVGNTATLQADSADFAGGQINLATAQIAATTIAGSNFGGKLAISTAAIGNNLSVHTGN